MPVIFYVGFCVNVLYYWGVMQAIVSRLGGFLNHVVGSTACESMCAAGNMLFGLEQSALMLYPYLPHATKAELHCFMTSGFASMSAVMMGSYIALGSLLGKAFTPLALSMGVPWQDCADVGEVIGIKVVANEFIAYHSLLAKKLD
ncbi:hypothetical protein V5799_012820, partial [Amblyomma americanum]